MKYISGAIYGFLILNIIVLIIMTGATFTTWENCFFYVDEWTQSERGIYFMFLIMFILAGLFSASGEQGVNK